MKNLKLLISFIAYCITHPHLTFWQSVSGWSGKFILQTNHPFSYKRAKDTFYLEAKKQ